MKKRLLLVSAAFLFACGGPGGGGEESTSSATPPPAPVAPFDPATAGAISGTVYFQGTAPELGTLRMTSDPFCAKQHATPPRQGFLVLGEDGKTLGNVFVYIKSGLEGRTFPVPSEPVVLDQSGCVYVPRVIGIQAGQTLVIRNSDETLHNIHSLPMDNEEFNIGQPVKGMETKAVFETAEVMVPFKCDVHRWMRSYAGVLDHPHFAVSPPDGSFAIGNLPPGDYVLEAWHERLGAQELKVSVAPSETFEADITFVFEGS